MSPFSVWTLLLCFSAHAADPLAAIEGFQQQLFEETAPSVVFLRTGRGLGSGFVVGPDGLVLTNAHVVKGSDTADVVLHDGRRVQGEVIERAAEVDLALLQIEATDLGALELAAAQDLAVGSWVAAVGHGEGGAWTFTTGMISNVYPAGIERPVFQTQIPLNPGNSGGPVLDRHGHVVGVVTAGLARAQAINFAIPSDVAFRSLEGLLEVCPCVIVHAPEGAPIYIDGVSVGAGPRAVLPVAEGRHPVFAIIDGRKAEAVADWPDNPEVTLE